MQVPDGADYCEKCGASQSNKGSHASINKQDVGKEVNNAFGCFIQMFVTPAGTIQKMAELPSLLAFGIMGVVLCLLQAVFALGVVHEVFGFIGGLVGGLLGGLGGGLMGSFYGGIPYGKIFGYSLLFAVFSMAGLAIGVYLCSKLFRGSARLESALGVAVGANVPLTAVLLLYIIFASISIWIGSIVYIFGFLVFAYCVFIGTKAMVSDENRAIYAASLSFIVMMVIQFIVIRIFM